jgi:hypothetical protein
VPAYVEIQPASAEQGADRDTEDLDRDELVCQVRQCFIDGVAQERGAAIAKLAREIGYERDDTRIHEAIDDTIRTAVRRGILENIGGNLKIAAKSIEQYEREFLKEQFLASLGGATWTQRDDAIRTFARWLGFRRTGPAIDETARSLINGLIRETRIESEGTAIRKTR